jgi:hypothetical protein
VANPVVFGGVAVFLFVDVVEEVLLGVEAVVVAGFETVVVAAGGAIGSEVAWRNNWSAFSCCCVVAPP